MAAVGVCGGARADKIPHEAAAANRRLLQWVARGRLRPHVSQLLPLEQAAEAMAAVMARTAQGRLVLRLR